MSSLKKLLDNTPKQVYNIFKKGEGGLDLSLLPRGVKKDENCFIHSSVSQTLSENYRAVKTCYDNNPDLFPTAPVFAGGFFRDLVWENSWPSDLDLFFNMHGMTPEEAEDNLCLFLHKAGFNYTEMDSASYAGVDGLNSFRVFNCDPYNGHRCHVQVILKDLGPPEEDPLYVVKDFNYNHGKAALSVAGEPEIHFHGHMVAGWEHKIHAYSNDKGRRKCKDKFWRIKGFKEFNCSDQPLPKKPKSDLKMWNPCSEILFEDKVPPLGSIQAAIQRQQLVNQVRNEFVNQFDPVRNNWRPVP